MYAFHICRQKQSASSTHEHENLTDSLKGGGRLKEHKADRDKTCAAARTLKRRRTNFVLRLLIILYNCSWL